VRLVAEPFRVTSGTKEAGFTGTPCINGACGVGRYLRTARAPKLLFIGTAPLCDYSHKEQNGNCGNGKYWPDILHDSL